MLRAAIQHPKIAAEKVMLVTSYKTPGTPLPSMCSTANKAAAGMTPPVIEVAKASQWSRVGRMRKSPLPERTPNIPCVMRVVSGRCDGPA